MFPRSEFNIQNEPPLAVRPLQSDRSELTFFLSAPIYIYSTGYQPFYSACLYIYIHFCAIFFPHFFSTSVESFTPISPCHFAGDFVDSQILHFSRVFVNFNSKQLQEKKTRFNGFERFSLTFLSADSTEQILCGSWNLLTAVKLHSMCSR